MLFLLCVVASLAKVVVTEQFARSINSHSGMTWTASVHEHFAGLTEGEISSMFMTELSEADLDIPYEEVQLDAPIPEAWSFYDAAPQCKLDTPDVGMCPSSWAFSTAICFAERRCMAGADPDLVDYSVQYIVSCSKEDGCMGGDPTKAWIFLRDTGVPSAECVPYSNETYISGDPGECPTECVDGTKIELVKASGGPKNVGKKNVENIQRALMKGGPVSARMTVFRDFLMYKNGIYRHTPGSIASGHQIVPLVGWGVENGIEYWIVRNFWTARWGENGFFRIVRGINECDIESKVISGEI